MNEGRRRMEGRQDIVTRRGESNGGQRRLRGAVSREREEGWLGVIIIAILCPIQT